MIPGNDRENETSAVNLATSDLSTAVSAVNTYSGAAPYLLEGRFRIKYNNAAGAGSAVNSGLVSASLGALTYGM